MIITRKSGNNAPTVKLDILVIEYVDKIKSLDIILSQKLNFDDHI